MDIVNARGWLEQPNPDGVDPDPEVTADAVRVVLVHLAALEADRAAAERLADAVEDYAFTTDKDVAKLRAAWQSYVETVDRPAADAGGAS